jgi:hypothetical protein
MPSSSLAAWMTVPICRCSCRAAKIYVVRKGDVIDATWKIEGISDMELSLVYLPLHLSQTLSVGSAQ